jgi:glycerol-1-phosphate dehydrogenase [NAD(P)+]
MLYGDSMNPWINILHEKLRAEGIPADPEKSRLVPAQFYATNMNELAAQFEGFVKSSGGTVKRLAAFVDGAPKRCSEKAGAEIDPVFRSALLSAGFPVDWVVLSERLSIAPAELHASHDVVEEIRQIVRSCGADLFFVLGSGSITDAVKHALFLEGIKTPLLSVPTALTVTAFTSAFSIIDFHGAKRTQLSREITATFWLRSVLECAPERMSRAGYGDLLARFVAYGDWYLGKSMGVMDRYDECAFRLMEPFADGIKESAGGFSLFPVPPQTIECISAALAMAGIAMSVSGETTPLSGFEHVISHGLDFLRLTSGRDLVLHGEQVALGTLTSANAIDWLLRRADLAGAKWREEPELEGLSALTGLINEAPFFGGTATTRSIGAAALSDLDDRVERAREEFSREYVRKARRWKAEMSRKEIFLKNWPDIRKNVERVTLPISLIAPLVTRSGLPSTPEETVPPTSMDEFIWALRFSPFVRARMNIADLIFWMGEDVAGTIYDPHGSSG